MKNDNGYSCLKVRQKSTNVLRELVKKLKEKIYGNI